PHQFLNNPQIPNNFYYVCKNNFLSHTQKLHIVNNLLLAIIVVPLVACHKANHARAKLAVDDKKKYLVQSLIDTKINVWAKMQWLFLNLLMLHQWFVRASQTLNQY